MNPRLTRWIPRTDVAFLVPEWLRGKASAKSKLQGHSVQHQFLKCGTCAVGHGWATLNCQEINSHDATGRTIFLAGISTLWNSPSIKEWSIIELWLGHGFRSYVSMDCFKAKFPGPPQHGIGKHGKPIVSLIFSPNPIHESSYPIWDYLSPWGPHVSPIISP